MEVCIVSITVSKLVVLPTGVELFTTTIITITTITTSIPTIALSHSGALAGNVLDNSVVFYVLWVELHNSELTINGISSVTSKCLLVVLQFQIT
jgi:hypothetical protein